MNASDLIGSLAAVITTSAMLPQLARAWRTKHTRDLSIVMLVALATGVTLWLIYGLMLGATPIIAANALTLVQIGTLLGLKLRFG